MDKNTLDKVMDALEKHYREYGMGRSMEYTFGFMDAMAVLRNLDTKRHDPQGRRDILNP